MPSISSSDSPEKDTLHPRSLHRVKYDFRQLIKRCPELKTFVKINQYGNESVDFSNSQAVKTLNKALLKYFYGIDFWEIPSGYLCPPIPGRADYIHYMADLLTETNGGTLPAGNKIRVLDIGTGANTIYPIIGNHAYGWKFIGSDIDRTALQSAQKIASSNSRLKDSLECRLQVNKEEIFNGIVKPEESFDLTICNPPFHASMKEASAGAVNKWKNLGIHKLEKTLLNFGGQGAELWCPGGEAAFIGKMIEESAGIQKNCCWFSSLVSKKESLPGIYKALEKAGATDTRTIAMAQGQKESRIIAWTFLDAAGLQEWKKRWMDAERNDSVRESLR